MRVKLDDAIDRIYSPIVHKAVEHRYLTVSVFVVALAMTTVYVGAGHIDFAAYLAALEEAGYHGPQIIRRSAGENPVQDIAAAKEHLERILRA